MSQSKNQSMRTNFAGVFLQDGERILLLKKKSDGNWWIPWGHLDTNETYTQCIIREVEEELKIHIDEKNLSKHILAHCVDKKKQKIFLWRYVLCTQRSGKPINNEPDKCSRIARYHKENLPETLPKCSQRVIQALEEGESYIEITF